MNKVFPLEVNVDCTWSNDVLCGDAVELVVKLSNVKGICCIVVSSDMAGFD